MIAILAGWNAPTLYNGLIAPRTDDAAQDATEAFAYYARCSEARAAGVAPIYRGSPGYRSGLDADGDGVACEPYR